MCCDLAAGALPEQQVCHHVQSCTRLRLSCCLSVASWLYIHAHLIRLQARFKSSKFEIRPEELQSLEAELGALAAPSLRTNLFAKDFQKQVRDGAASACCLLHKTMHGCSVSLRPWLRPACAPTCSPRTSRSRCVALLPLPGAACYDGVLEAAYGPAL
jgi:hypothetical protein